MKRKSSQQGVPQIWINNYPIVGFDKAKIDRMLKNQNNKKGEKNGKIN